MSTAGAPVTTTRSVVTKTLWYFRNRILDHSGSRPVYGVFQKRQRAGAAPDLADIRLLQYSRTAGAAPAVPNPCPADQSKKGGCHDIGESMSEKVNSGGGHDGGDSQGHESPATTCQQQDTGGSGYRGRMARGKCSVIMATKGPMSVVPGSVPALFNRGAWPGASNGASQQRARCPAKCGADKSGSDPTPIIAWPPTANGKVDTTQESQHRWPIQKTADQFSQEVKCRRRIRADPADDILVEIESRSQGGNPQEEHEAKHSTR